MKILSIGGFSNYGISNTCLHRHWSLEANSSSIDSVDTSVGSLNLYYRVVNKLFNLGLSLRLPDLSGINNKIVTLVSTHKYDVIWIDKGNLINKSTLVYIKNNLPNAKIVSFSPDNMALRHNQSQNYLDCIPYYDFTFTTKSFIIEDLKKMGLKNIHLVHKTYDEKFHFPRELSKEDLFTLAADVGFIGACEKERCESILYLVDNGIKVTVYGDKKWEKYKNYNTNLSINKGLYSDQYPKALQAFKISLCFLRKKNSDQHTARSMEIPACGGFMIAERTQQHLELFEEKKEAEFFETNEELLSKCVYYLTHEDERKRIIVAAQDRCENSGYSNQKTIKKLLAKVIEGC